MKFTPQQLKLLLPALVLSISLLSAWAIVAFRTPIKTSAPEAVIPEVQFIQLEPQNLRLTVTSQGIVTPREEIDLVREISGTVTEVHTGLVNGGFFAANDLLLRIDSRDYDYAVINAQAQVAEAKRVLMAEQAQVQQAENEWQALGEGDPSELALRKPQLAEAQAKLQAAEAQLAKAKLDRQRCEIRAPFAGRVVSKQAGLGQYLQSGQTVARIYASDIAEIRLPIATEQLAFLDLPLNQNQQQPKQLPQVSLSAEVAGLKQIWHGHIVRSEAALDTASGQLYLVAQVDHPYQAETPLISGLFVSAEIEGTVMPNLFSIPHHAINAMQKVKLVDANQRLHWQTVEVLKQAKDRVIIKQGLNAGDRLIVSELALAIEGMPVNAHE